MQVGKAPRKLGKPNQQANNIGKEQTTQGTAKANSKCCIPPPKLFYFLFSHTLAFVGQNPRTITEICNLYVPYICLYISTEEIHGGVDVDPTKSVQRAGKSVEVAR